MGNDVSQEIGSKHLEKLNHAKSGEKTIHRISVHSDPASKRVPFFCVFNLHISNAICSFHTHPMFQQQYFFTAPPDSQQMWCIWGVVITWRNDDSYPTGLHLHEVSDFVGEFNTVQTANSWKSPILQVKSPIWSNSCVFCRIKRKHSV